MGGGIPHGPHAMVMQQQQLVKPITAVKEDAAAESIPALRKPSEKGKALEDVGSDAKAQQAEGNNAEKAVDTDTGGT